MTPDMEFECLLVSPDPPICSIVDRILRDFSVCTSICPSSSGALLILAKGQTDLLVVDSESAAFRDLSHELWRLRIHQPTVVAASTRNGPIPGVHIVMRKPVTAESGMHSLRSAYSRMLLDHRRYARCALMATVEAVDDRDQKIMAVITDIGNGGIGVSSQHSLSVGELLSFGLPLSGRKKDIFVQVRVLWTLEDGRTGCEFARIPPDDRLVLDQWLADRIQIKKPLIPL
jgi:hypothetical protein